MLRKAVLLLFLLPCALQDHRTKTVSVPFCAVFSAAGIFLSVRGGTGIPDLCFSVLPGLFLILLSRLSRGAVGAGDGLVLVSSGTFLTLPEVLSVFCLGVLLSAAYAAFLLLWHRLRGKDRFAFLPFLLAGTVLYEVLLCL